MIDAEKARRILDREERKLLTLAVPLTARRIRAAFKLVREALTEKREPKEDRALVYERES